MSDTPRTDAAAVKITERGLNNQWDTELVDASFARELERYLRAAAHALQSYRYGNGSPDLAERLAADIKAFLTADI